MDDKKDAVKDQLVHIIGGTLIFVVIATVAVLLDLAGQRISTLGVSSFTATAINTTAHCMLGLDLLLFSIYLARQAYVLVKETFL